MTSLIRVNKENSILNYLQGEYPNELMNVGRKSPTEEIARAIEVSGRVKSQVLGSLKVAHICFMSILASNE